MKSSSCKEDPTTSSYPRALSSITASICGLAVFLVMASLLLVSQSIGSAVHGYFYGVDRLVSVDYQSNMTIPYTNDDKQIFGKGDPIQTIVDEKGNSSTYREPKLTIVGETLHASGQNTENIQDYMSVDKKDSISQQKYNGVRSDGEIDDPKSHYSSNSIQSDLFVPSLTPTTGENKTNVDAGCDLYHGKWVFDSLGPLYTNNTCPVLTQTQNCQGNGRPDKDYENWRWKPFKCDLPRFDATNFLELMREKH